jgi:hypothetical protein
MSKRANDAVRTKKNQKGPFFRRGRNPNSLANLQRRGAVSNNPAGRRGKNSLQSELEAIFFNREGEKYLRDLQKTERMLRRSFLKHTGGDLDAACERAYGWKLSPPERKPA